MRYSISSEKRTSYSASDGLYVSYLYDNAGELTLTEDSTGTILTSYAYDDLGRRTITGRANGVNSYSYFDGNQRLSQMTHTYPDGSKTLTRPSPGASPTS